MRETHVVCGGLRPTRRSGDVLELDVNVNTPPSKRVLLKLDTLTRQLVDNVDPALCDALEIAAYILMADRMTTRGTDQMGRMGADWRRRFRLRVPVRRHDLWSRPEIQDCLTQTLNFLSEDEFTFQFEPTDRATGLEPFLAFDDRRAQTIQPNDVILFSGGLDSLAGAVEQLISHERDAVLVTHKSSTNVAGRQDQIVEKLRSKLQRGQKLFYAPVWVRKGDYEPVEHSQRTRSFLFVSLGVTVASLFGRDELQFFENGVTSFNLPIAEHVIGTRASRTTHPRVLASFSRLFSLLAERPVTIENK